MPRDSRLPLLALLATLLWTLTACDGDGGGGESGPDTNTDVTAPGPDGGGADIVQSDDAGGSPDATSEDVPEVPPLGARLELTESAPSVTALAWEAIGDAPDWMFAELLFAFRRLTPEFQDVYGALVVELEDPYLVDEVAFSVAHTSPEILMDDNFLPQLLVENAEAIYAVDPDLPYVELVEYGDPAAGGDFHTTTRYRIQLEDGEVVEDESDREHYYWFVVHPRLEDEIPYYISPYLACSADSLQCPKRPPLGYFWRTFLYTAKDPNGCPTVGECPVLKELLQEQDYLWSYASDEVEGNGAIGAITAWVNGVLDFGAGRERSVQPSRIYGLHAGNCGEHADMTSAAGRTALVPLANVGAGANDHTWNEFWERGTWRQMEPVGLSIDKFTYYVDENGDYRRNRNRQDDDCDGVADEGLDVTDDDEDGLSEAEGDCNDADPLSYPDAVERADGRDNDCDGLADEGAADVDADADGQTLAEGDCDDNDATVHTGAEELVDRRDNDCDGVADNGADSPEAGDQEAARDDDEDGWTLADGDCDDGAADTYPGAAERPDGRDNDCDGVADEEMMAADFDGDGWSLDDGDCNDLSGNAHPEADDPSISNNRVYAVTGSRGDGSRYNRTDDYSGPFTLNVDVRDRNGEPIDGAVVAFYGPVTVYAHMEGSFWLAAEAYTGLSGALTLAFGEANDYFARVETPIGNLPLENNRIEAVTETGVWPAQGDVVDWTVEIDGEIPPALLLEDAPALELSDEPAALRVILRTAFSGHITGVPAYAHSGSFGQAGADGAVTRFITDADGYAAFLEGESVPARAIARAEAAGEETLTLSGDRDWYLVIANPRAVATSMVGTLDVTVEAAAGDEADGWLERDTVSADLLLPPQGHAAVLIQPLPAE